jgi:hypothetical protein
LLVQLTLSPSVDEAPMFVPGNEKIFEMNILVMHLVEHNQ